MMQRILVIFLLGMSPHICFSQKEYVEFGYQHLDGFQTSTTSLNWLGIKVGGVFKDRAAIFFGIYGGSQKLDFRHQEYFSQGSLKNETLHSTLMSWMNNFELGLALPVLDLSVGNFPHFLDFGFGINGIQTFSQVNFISSELSDYGEETAAWGVHQSYKMGKKFGLGVNTSLSACISLFKSPQKAKGIILYLAIGYKLGAGGLIKQANYSYTDDEKLAGARVEEEKSGKNFYFQSGSISNSMYGTLNIGLLWRYAPKFK